MLVGTSLASGSSGNALLIRYAATVLLVDCGLTLRMIEQYSTLCWYVISGIAGYSADV